MSRKRLEPEDPGGDVVELDERRPEPEQDQVLAQLMVEAAEAREDPVKFFNFVMRDEEENKPIRAGAHQRIIVNFALHAKDSRGNTGRCVLILPIEHAKTSTMTAVGLFKLQQNPRLRGGIISAKEAQAAKVLSTIRTYIESSAELRMVAPDLVPSSRPGAPWTQTQLEVQRDTYAKDPTLEAFGLDGERFTGARFDWILADDLLTEENCATKEQRDKTFNRLMKVVHGRLVPGGHLVVCNSAKHPEDTLHRLKSMGWPTLLMDAYGGILISGTDFGREGELCAEELVPWEEGSEKCMTAEMADEPEEERRTLFPQRFPRSRLDALNDPSVMLPIVFAQNYLSLCRADDAMCSPEIIDLCLRKGRELGIFNFVSKYEGTNVTFTGVDLAVAQDEKADYVTLCTFEVRPDLGNLRVILDLERGRWPGPVIVQKIIQKATAYKSVVTVENNAAQQFILDFVRAEDVGFPLKAHTTGKAKANAQYGVPAFFIEMAGGGWAFPCRRLGPPAAAHPTMQHLIDECLYYAPTKHTGDLLMGVYFARETARKFGASFVKKPKDPLAAGRRGQSIGDSLTSR